MAIATFCGVRCRRIERLRPGTISARGKVEAVGVRCAHPNLLNLSWVIKSVQSDPYKAPSSDVEVARGNRPIQLYVSVALLSMSYLLGLLAHVDMADLLEFGPNYIELSLFMIISVGGTLGLWFGVNWVKWLLSGAIFLGFLVVVARFFTVLTPQGLFDLLVGIVQVIAIALLFAKPCRTWFAGASLRESQGHRLG